MDIVSYNLGYLTALLEFRAISYPQLVTLVTLSKTHDHPLNEVEWSIICSLFPTNVDILRELNK